MGGGGEAKGHRGIGGDRTKEEETRWNKNEGGTENYRFQVAGGDIQQGGNTGLFYGTSQLREMVREENEGLAAPAIERGWGINMWRGGGGGIEHIKKWWTTQTGKKWGRR